MALAIKTLTAKHAYGDITTAFTDDARPGTMENCPTCGAQFVLYYGQRLEIDAAIAWLQGVLRGICPAHNGWLAVDEQPPVPREDHRRRIERLRYFDSMWLQKERLQLGHLGMKEIA